MQTYYTCLLLHVGCTTSAHVALEVFGDGADDLSRNLIPVLFGSPHEMTRALMRTVAPGRPLVVRAAAIAQALPRAARAAPEINAAARCEVAEMLVRRLGLGGSIAPLFVQLQERWDGKGDPGQARRDEIPLAMRIAHVARDADTHGRLGGTKHAVAVMRERAGRAFDPAVAACFADLASPYLVGHSAGVARLASAAATHARLDAQAQRALERAARVHDVGRVAVPIGWRSQPRRRQTALARRRVPADWTPPPSSRCATDWSTRENSRLPASLAGPSVTAATLDAKEPRWQPVSSPRPQSRGRWTTSFSSSSTSMSTRPTLGSSRSPGHRTVRSGPGTTLRFDHGDGRETTMRFTSVETNRRIGFEGHVGPLRPSGVFDIAPIAGAAKLTVRVAPNPVGPLKLLSPLVHRIGQRVWDQRLARIKAAIEAPGQ